MLGLRDGTEPSPASMGPSLGSDGKYRPTGQGLLLRLASMGPSLGSDGKIEYGCEVVLGEELQWGRRLGATERSRRCRSR